MREVEIDRRPVHAAGRQDETIHPAPGGFAFEMVQDCLADAVTGLASIHPLDLARTGRQTFDSDEFLEWLQEQPEHEAWPWFFGEGAQA